MAMLSLGAMVALFTLGLTGVQAQTTSPTPPVVMPMDPATHMTNMPHTPGQMNTQMSSGQMMGPQMGGQMSGQMGPMMGSQNGAQMGGQTGSQMSPQAGRTAGMMGTMRSGQGTGAGMGRRNSGAIAPSNPGGGSPFVGPATSGPSLRGPLGPRGAGRAGSMRRR